MMLFKMATCNLNIMHEDLAHRRSESYTLGYRDKVRFDQGISRAWEQTQCKQLQWLKESLKESTVAEGISVHTMLKAAQVIQREVHSHARTMHSTTMF
jgi:hypothetical protein